MNFLKKLFTPRSAEDHLRRGDALFAAHSYYEARSAYEEGLQCSSGTHGQEDVAGDLEAKIAETGRAMADLNLQEAEHALRRGDAEKAVEHLELAKTLTCDTGIREKADSLMASVPEKSNDTKVLAASPSCSSCSQSGADEDDSQPYIDPDLPLAEHYDLLIHQLPTEMYGRYRALGEDFAYMYVAASGDNHQVALDLLEKWFTGADRDIYCYEKGQILHRLGRAVESEKCFREAVSQNPGNPLAHLGLALLLVDDDRLTEAAVQLDHMIAGGLLAGQALMMRGEVHELSGETEAAIELYGSLLETPLARAAAERLYVLLMETGRQPEAQHVFKRFLGSCKH
jgi:tetratricopeptide (TPR) repeat protein